MKIPQTLHKYLYVGANPVQYWDPNGRSLIEYGSLLQKAVAATALVAIIAEFVTCAVEDIEAALESVPTDPKIRSNHRNSGCLLHDEQEPPDGPPPPGPPRWPDPWEK
jgi:hypothetical protein